MKVSNKSKEEELFEQVDSIDDAALARIPEEKSKPRMGDPDWSDWVLSQLAPDERDQKNNLPKTAGLNRLVYKILGRIIRSETHYVHVPEETNGFTSTVLHTLVIEPRDGGENQIFTGVGDANDRNCDAPFSRYLSPIASTRALGRACRDALMIKGATAEEISQVANDGDDVPASSAQKTGIQTLCKRLSIDVDKFINMGQFKFRSLDRVPTGVAESMMGLLNKYQQGTEIPGGIKL